MSEAKRVQGRLEHSAVSIHVRLSPLEAELIDLRLAYMAEDAASNSSVTCFWMSSFWEDRSRKRGHGANAPTRLSPSMIRPRKRTNLGSYR